MSDTAFSRFYQEFVRGNSMVKKLIWLNVGFFMTYHIIRALLFMGGAEKSFYESISPNLMLPLSFETYFSTPWTLITHMFLHEGIWHIVFNMLMLFWMGTNFQDYLGNNRLLKVYIFGGITGAILLLLVYAILPTFTPYQGGFALGASAAVYAITVATATLIPDYEVRLYGLFNLRLKHLAMILVLLSFVEIGRKNTGGNIAHLGGALFGFLYIKNLYWRANPFDRLAYWWKTVRQRRRPRRAPQKNEKGNTFISPSNSRKATQEEIDMILDKINASGYESLNQYEKDMLYQYSHDED